MAPAGGGALALERPFGLVPRAPGEHCAGEHVVKDLIARAGAVPRRQRAYDPRLGEVAQHYFEAAVLVARVAGEIGDTVGDLRSGWRDQLVEESRCQLAAAFVERGEGALEVLLHDPVGAPKLRERLGPEHVRVSRALDLPEALEHELEVRRLDASRI